VFYRTREVRHGVGVIISWDVEVEPRFEGRPNQPWYKVLPYTSNYIPIRTIEQGNVFFKLI
jgi:hypothetical protein